MTHAIRVRAAPSAVPDDAHEQIESVKETYNGILDAHEYTVQTVRADDLTDSPETVCGIYRFDDAEEKAAITAAFSDDVFAGSKWYLLESHVCTHHDSDPSGQCGGWVVEESRGDVPEAVL